MESSYLDLLNPQQRDAVVYTSGPQLIIAGAGSGKTRVLTYKIVHLLKLGFESYRIMALTFTNKAAREMKERIIDVVGSDISSKLWMGTFHSIFLRILRRHSEEVGFKSGFTIYDAADSKSLIKMIIKDLDIDDKIYKPTAIASIISNAKNAMILPEQYMSDKDRQKTDQRSNRPMIGQIYKLYMERCRLANAMDFDDILLYTNILLRDHDDIRRHYQEFFRYILVDEYQDTNFAQHLVISQLTGTSRNLCVVGDDAQSIYSFRGASITNILTLDKRYPDLKIFKLERNYRSTQNIINAAGSLIDNNIHQMKKNVYSENSIGSPVEIIRTYSDLEEAYIVAAKITGQKLISHDSYDDYAILYRTNAQSRVLEESLRKRNIPYRIYGGLSFYQRKEIKDIISYFRLTVNPDDDEALRRIINFPARGIGETTMKKLIAAATLNRVSLWTIVCNPDNYNVNINSGTKKKLNDFRQLISDFITDNSKGEDAYHLGQLIYNRTGILLNLQHENTPESISRKENLNELLSGLKEFVEYRYESGEDNTSMSAFLSEVSLATDMDKNEEEIGPKITLMTVHAAKGLEFKHIYVVGVEEELFPSAMAINSSAEIEEERRLLYVAITRAKETCTLLYAGSRFRNGQTTISRPSRFLYEISPKFTKISSSSGLDSSKSFSNPVEKYHDSMSYSNNISSVKNYGKTYISSQSSQIDKQSDNPDFRKLKPLSELSKKPAPQCQIEGRDKLKIGSKVEHPKFGIGIVVNLCLMSNEEVAVVNFNNVGERKLLLKFAKFKVLN